MSGERLSVRLPRRIVPIWVSEPIGLAMPAPDRLDAGHERGGDRAHAGSQDAELAGGGLDVRFCVRASLTSWQLPSLL